MRPGSIFGHTLDWSNHRLPWLVGLVAWQFVYFAYPWAVSGKSFGMAVLGLRVVKASGAPAGPRQAVIRTLTLPLSFLIFGLGLVGIVVGRERRALHDLFAGTAVVYAWDATGRPAQVHGQEHRAARRPLVMNSR